jgi:c-di-GMP-binding flagellar brake protein YcgR
VSEAFFRALADAFSRNRSATGSVETALVVLLAFLAALQLGAWSRRAWRRRTRLHALALAHGIAAEDLSFARRLAAAEGVLPFALLTRVDVFERATARALAAADPAEAAEPVQRLRRALGFDRLPAHTPLLTTRELAPGMGLAAGPAQGVVEEVRETAFTVAVRGDPGPAVPGATLALSLVHAREARYELRCKVLERLGGGGDPVLVLAHDEAPRRTQQREFVRVATRAVIALHPVPPWPSRAEIPVDVMARLEDVSGGGARVTSRAPLPVGLLTRARFTVDDERFEALPAVVIAAERRPDGACRAHLEWGRIAEAERSRLVAAVARLELRTGEEPA